MQFNKIDFEQLNLYNHLTKIPSIIKELGDLQSEESISKIRKDLRTTVKDENDVLLSDIANHILIQLAKESPRTLDFQDVNYAFESKDTKLIKTYAEQVIKYNEKMKSNNDFAPYIRKLIATSINNGDKELVSFLKNEGYLKAIDNDPKASSPYWILFSTVWYNRPEILNLILDDSTLKESINPFHLTLLLLPQKPKPTPELLKVLIDYVEKNRNAENISEAELMILHFLQRNSSISSNYFDLYTNHKSKLYQELGENNVHNIQKNPIAKQWAMQMSLLENINDKINVLQQKYLDKNTPSGEKNKIIVQFINLVQDFTKENLSMDKSGYKYNQIDNGIQNEDLSILIQNEINDFFKENKAPVINNLVDGYPPLQWAIKNELVGCVKAILSVPGIDVETKNKNGQTAIEYIEQLSSNGKSKVLDKIKEQVINFVNDKRQENENSHKPKMKN